MERTCRFDAIDSGDDPGGDRAREVGELGAGARAEFEDSTVSRGDEARDGSSFVLWVMT